MLIGVASACMLSLCTVWAPASAQYATPSGPLTVDSNEVDAGQTVTVAGSGFAAGSTVRIVLVSEASGSSNKLSSDRNEKRQVRQSSEVVLGESITDAAGRFSADVTIPADFAGTGVLEARGTTEDGAVRVLSVTIVDGAVSTLPATGSGSSTPLVASIAGIVLATGALLALLARRFTTHRVW